MTNVNSEGFYKIGAVAGKKATKNQGASLSSPSRHSSDVRDERKFRVNRDCQIFNNSCCRDLGILNFESGDTWARTNADDITFGV